MVKIAADSGWTPPETYFKGDDGTYPATLVRIGVEDKNGQFTAGGTRIRDGQFGEKTVQDWRFALEDGQVIDIGITAPKVKNGEESIHPKSTYYAYVVALFGKEPPEGFDFDPQQHLIGRMAYIRIQRDENQIPRIRNIGAMPVTSTPAPAAAPVATPPPPPAAAAPVAAPLREAVAAGAVPELPF